LRDFRFHFGGDAYMSVFRRRHRLAAPLRARKLALRLELLEDRTLLSGFAQSLANPGYIIYHPSGSAGPLGTSGPTGTTPTQIRHAYGFDQISFPGASKADGSGTTIAIVDAYDDPNIANDLQQFDAKFNIPNPTFTKVDQNGGTNYPSADSGWASEIALDVEWSHAIAPGAKILLVEASDNSFNNLLSAVSFAANQPGVVAVSMSWGGGEFSSETGFDSTFVTPSGHSGVTFLASSGDSGAPPIYPGTSPNVVAVGGTTLNVDSSGNIVSESGWNGSGGGISTVESQPAYQKGVVTQSSTRRTNPDVAYDANPNTGFPVYDSYNNGTATPWSQFGGTSDAAPQWAGLIAIADQGRALAGKGTLDGRSQTLPMLYQLSVADFHDIITGSSQGSPVYSAGSGYDLVTGRGTPLANKIVADLVGTVSVTHFNVSAVASATAGAAFSVTVTALDQNNQTVTGYTGTVHFTSSDGSAILPANYTFVAGDNGVHTFTNGVTLKKAGNQTVTVSDASATSISGSAAVTVTAANPDHLVFSQQPTNAVAGSAISPAVTVQVLDLYGNLVASDQTDAVSVALGANPGGGTLGGTTTATVSNGVASFGSLSINKTGTGYTLKATSGSLGAATSSTFNIAPGTASQLAFGQQPTNTPAGSTISPAVTVQILDANGNVVTTDNSDAVTIGLGANPGGGTLSGTLTVTAQNGLASFSSLSISTPGTGYTLTATSGSLAGATSATFNVTQAGTHLFFGQQPTDTVAGSSISPAVTVQVLDSNNTVVTTDNSDNITLAIGTNAGGGTLGGTTTVTVSAGVATFGNLSINKTGSGYTLVASSGNLNGATSTSFNVTPGQADHLAFVQQPTNTAAGSAISPAVTVEVLDANNNVATTDQTDSVSLAIGTNAGGGTLSGTTTLTVSNGVATFGNLSINKTGTGYTLKASSGTLISATSGAFNITPGKVDHLAFGQQPSNASLGGTIAPAVTVQVLDANNNLVTTDNTDAVTLTLANNPTGAALSGTNPVTASGGVATFSNLSINLAGSGYTLGASSGTLTGATSTSFNVTAGSTVIENFDQGLGLYFVAGGTYVYAGTGAYAAHDPINGLDTTSDPGWLVRNDAAAHVQQGETLSVWVQFADGITDGRAYFGFGASRSGTLSLVLAGNTRQLLIQDNSGYGYVDMAAVSQTYVPNHWYRLEVAWGTGGAITGRLYDSNGTTLLNSVQGTDSNITSGGIAFRATWHDKYFDTVTVTQGTSPHSIQSIGATPPLGTPGGATDGDADAARPGGSGQLPSTGPNQGLTVGTITASQSGGSLVLLAASMPVVVAPVPTSSVAVSLSSPSVNVGAIAVPVTSTVQVLPNQDSGGGDLAGSEQGQNGAPAIAPDAAIQPAESAPLPDNQNVPDTEQAAAPDQLATDAYFAAMDFSLRDPRAESTTRRDATVIVPATAGGSEAAVAAFLLGFAILGQDRGNERTRRRWRR
jgi:hypothetical protein